MTITNHMRRIEERAGHVLVFVDARKYREAHHALYDIEERALLAHEHIDHLMDVTAWDLVPAGES